MKKWYLVTVFLYLLALVALTVPVIVLSFVDELVEIGWRDIGEIYSSAIYWFIIAVPVICQAGLISFQIKDADRRPARRGPLILPILTSGFLILLLILAAYFAILETFDQGARGPFDNEYHLALMITLGVALFMWALWSLIFFKMTRRDSASDIIALIARRLYHGSILELLVAVPTHIFVRSKEYCCAGVLTFIGISTGLAVMLASFGPALYFLFTDRAKKLKLRQGSELATERYSTRNTTHQK